MRGPHVPTLRCRQVTDDKLQGLGTRSRSAWAAQPLGDPEQASLGPRITLQHPT